MSGVSGLSFIRLYACSIAFIPNDEAVLSEEGELHPPNEGEIGDVFSYAEVVLVVVY